MALKRQREEKMPCRIRKINNSNKKTTARSEKEKLSSSKKEKLSSNNRVLKRREIIIMKLWCRTMDRIIIMTQLLAEVS